MKMRRRHLAIVLALAAVAAGAVSAAVSRGGDARRDNLEPNATREKITLQLAWTTQTRFAGYYAALAKGYYRRAGLDVEVRPGGPDVIPEQVVLGRRAQFGVDWLPSLLALRDRGKNLVNIAQIFRRSGTTELTWKSSGIDSFHKMRGRRFGVWGTNNAFEQEAALLKFGLDPRRDLTLVNQGLNMGAFLERKIDAASAMTYDELARVLETKNPRTGRPYRIEDLHVFSYQKLGTGMLQDGIFVNGDWIRDKSHQAIAVRFLEASFEGWVYCRDHLARCVSLVLAQDPKLPRRHETWQLNEVDALIWPSQLALGVMDSASYRRTAAIASEFKVVRHPVTKAFRTDLARAAVAALARRGIDVHGKRWRRSVVTPTLGGK